MKISKHLFDLIGAVISIFLLYPLFIGIAVLIKVDDGGSVFFRQERVGYKGKTFKIYKFRTMVVDAEKMGAVLTLEGDKRITRVGRFLRRLKLDELPQLFNVLQGNMSLVGPRPEVPAFVEQYEPEWHAVLDARPGMTSLGSLYFKNEETLLSLGLDRVTWYKDEILPKKILLELKYIKEASFISDLRVILVTVSSLFFDPSKDFLNAIFRF